MTPNSDIKSLVAALRTVWATANVPFQSGVDERQIAAFESRYQVMLPDDVRYYFRSINGFEPGFTEDSFLEFLPLDDLRSVPEDLGGYGGIPDYRGIIQSLPRADQWFVIVDYLSHSHVYAIHLHTGITGRNEVVAICGSLYAKVASSWTDFLTSYLYRPKTSLGL